MARRNRSGSGAAPAEAGPRRWQLHGDIAMLDFTQHPGKPSLRLLILHDDSQREFDYTSGAEQALERADKSGWTIVSIENDWTTVDIF